MFDRYCHSENVTLELYVNFVDVEENGLGLTTVVNTSIVLHVGDEQYIARIHGLDEVMVGELV